MTRSYPNDCDETRLDRYLEGELAAGEKARMEAHFEACQPCRRQAAAMATFSQDFRDRVQHAAESVNYVALEKQVLTKALRQHRSRSGFSRFVASLKYAVPVAMTAGLLIFFAYSHFRVKPAPLPSAIINSFTGSMSSVMIFETPETRQTILWYTEDTNVESEQHAG